MLTKVDRLEIQKFVKGTLGCTCPNEVFAAIERHDNSVISQTAPYSIKLLIGQRLLIYIVNLADLASLTSLLPTMLRQGKKERDEKGFNRFRAVILTHRKDEVEPLAIDLLNRLADKDENVHLHIVDESEWIF